MKYCVKNQLDLFEYHDTELRFVSFENNNLILKAKCLNIHKNTKENPSDCDMEIESAILTFYGYEIISTAPLITIVTDSNGNTYFDEPKEITGKEAENSFLNELKKGSTIFHLDFQRQENKNISVIDFSYINCYNIKFSFDSVKIEWDNYSQKAWYEKNKNFHYKITLITPNCEIQTDLSVNLDEKIPYNQGITNQPNVFLSIKYQDNEIHGQGNDYLWVDAFADLQKKLPPDVIIKCCMTCRHGNMCPYGNKPGELFCTSDLKINSKMDMCDLFNNDSDVDEMTKRSRNYTDVCENYQHQSKDFYTYNDYLYHFDN